MRFVNRASVAFAAVCFSFASAGHALIMIQAGSGHPHLGSGTANWDAEWATGNAFKITDGRGISLPLNSPAMEDP